MLYSYEYMYVYIYLCTYLSDDLVNQIVYNLYLKHKAKQFTWPGFLELNYQRKR